MGDITFRNYGGPRVLPPNTAVQVFDEELRREGIVFFICAPTGSRVVVRFNGDLWSDEDQIGMPVPVNEFVRWITLGRTQAMDRQYSGPVQFKYLPRIASPSIVVTIEVLEAFESTP